MCTFPVFMAIDASGEITGMYEAGRADRCNFRMVYGIARADARTTDSRVICGRVTYHDAGDAPAYTFDSND